ncbi:hypothetical protein [Leptolyngbya sp. CCY15150]|uniref:hypothetical protein n=1 Tax=Leptolyngbya sp. CCY15150 TaxID=2767772 RepID=UPI00194EDE24|nr:hypothetical protein [Leptolyngbya sp. CCY15150]
MKRVLSRWGRFVTTTLSRTLSHTSRLTGTLRQNKRRDRREVFLLESLETVTAERDHLLVECDRLTQECDRLRQDAREFEQYAEHADTENHRLRQDNQQLRQTQEFEQYADDENQHLRQDNEQLRQECDRLTSDYNDLQLQALEQEEQIESLKALLTYYEANLAHTPVPATESETDPASDPPVLDLSAYSVALVGGHSNTRQGVIQTLSDSYGLKVKNCVEIPPFTEVSTSSSKVKAKISRCDLIVIITGYMGHGLTKIVQDLNSAGALAGEILMLDCRGKSGVVREIVNYFHQAVEGDRSPQGT